MSTPLLARFKDWLGRWRGFTQHYNGTRALAEYTFTSHLGGELIQLDVIVIDPESGETLNYGTGMLALDARGMVINVMAGDRLGHGVLRENPDDPEVLALEGRLAGNRDFVITFRLQGDEMHYTSRFVEGYAAQESGPRFVTTLKRVRGDVL